MKRTDILRENIVGPRLKALRNTKDWNQDDLAHHSGVGKSTISKIEQGLRWPERETAYALAGALGAPVWQLFVDPSSIGAQEHAIEKGERLALYRSISRSLPALDEKNLRLVLDLIDSLGRGAERAGGA